MSFEEAINKLIDAIPDVENYAEVIDVIRSGNSSNGEDWKEKYEGLQEKYRARFKEEVNDSMKQAPNSVIMPEDANEPKEITWNDLDFSGINE